MSSDTNNFSLPFGASEDGKWRLDNQKKAVARSLAEKMGIMYSSNSSGGSGHPVGQNVAALVPANVQVELRERARRDHESFVNQGQIVKCADICSQKMSAKSLEHSLYLNFVAQEAGFYVYDLPDSTRDVCDRGFVILDPADTRATAWHPVKETREAACVVGSLVLREAKSKGAQDVDDLEKAFNSLAMDPETGGMRDLERAIGGMGLDEGPKDTVQEISLSAYDLPNIDDTPDFLACGHNDAGGAQNSSLDNGNTFMDNDDDDDDDFMS